MTQVYSTAHMYPSRCSEASILRPSSLRLDSRPATAWLRTHSLRLPLVLLMLKHLPLLRTSITDVFLLRTSCDLFPYQHRDPAGSLFLCLNRCITSTMPRGTVNKQEIQARIYKLKTALYDSTDMFNCFSEEKKEGAHDALNRVLDILQEYRN